jgi:hemolysin activation/secretion protein
LEKRLNTRSKTLATLCLLGPLSTAALAADPPDAGAVQRLEREQIERLMQEQRLQQKPVQPEVTLPGAPAARAASQTRNIPVTAFQVDESAILTAEEIRTVLAPYEGKTVSLADLFEAVAGLNKLYQAKGMPTARAFLPPQEIKDGLVRIRLVEARVGEIRLGPTSQVSQAFVDQRLGLEPGDLMSVSRLEADLLRFNRLHDVQLRAGVEPGKAPGTTDVRLVAAEPARNQFSLFADNAGRYTVGEERLGFSARRLGLTGRGDSLLFAATFSEGSDSYYLGYSLPLAYRDMKLDVSYSNGGIEVVEGAFVPLDVSGTSQDFTLGLTLPLVVEAQRLWNVYGRLSAKESISKFGSATQQDLDLRVLTLGVSGEWLAETSARTLDAHMALGVQELGGDESFSVYRVNGAWMQRLSPRSQLLLRGSLQYSPDDLLPASEQFQLGGSASVRGYSEGLLSGRHGYLLSAEWRYAFGQETAPDVQSSAAIPRVTGFLFLDHGGAFPYRPAPLKDITNDDFLTGAGLGMILNWQAGATARVALGWPLNSNPGEIKDRQPRLHAWLGFNW